MNISTQWRARSQVPIWTLLALALAGCPQGKQTGAVVGGCTGGDCGGGQVCNPCSRRCIADPGPVAEGEFAATFSIPQRDGEDTAEQNVLGIVRWDQEEHVLCIGDADVIDGVTLLLFSPSEEPGAVDNLQVTLPYEASSLPLSTDIPIVDRYIAEERDFGTNGLWETNYFTPELLAARNRGSDVYAVVDEGIASFSALATDGNGDISGTVRGRLRAAGPFEREILGGGCRDDQGVPTEDVFFDPRTTADVCIAPFSDHTLLMALTCRYHEEPANQSVIDGLGALTVRNNDLQRILGTSFCTSSEDGGRVSLRAAASKGLNNGEFFVLNAEIPAEQLQAGAVLDIGTEVTASLDDGVVVTLADGSEDIAVVREVPLRGGQIGVEALRLEESRGYIALWLSCGDGTVDSCFASSVLTGITIDQGAFSVGIGDTRALTVTGTFDDNSTGPVAAGIEWSSSDPAVATVDASGVVTARAPGRALVTAAIGGFTATVEVEVFNPDMAVPLPMVVDTNYPNRSAFGDGPNMTPLHTEDGQCPPRAGDAAGACHRFAWDGTGGGFTGTFWTVGEAFTNLRALPVEAGATEVSFWAWGANGGEVVQFGAGLGSPWDGVEDRANIILSTVPTQYRVPLTNLAGYTDVYGPFLVSIGGGPNPNGVEFYVDDIKWQRGAPPSGELVVFGDNYGNDIRFVAFGESTNDLAPDATNPQSGVASLRIRVPSEGYTGGALTLARNVDLSGFNAVAFWARANQFRTLDVVGVANDGQGNALQVERLQIPLVPGWQQYVLPIPDPSVLTAEDGLFHFAEGSDQGPYTLWLDDIRLVTLRNITNVRPAFTALTRLTNVGQSFRPTGMNVRYSVGGAEVQVFPTAPHFDWTSSNPVVATIDEDGVGTAVSPGTALITGALQGLPAAGTLTVFVNP